MLYKTRLFVVLVLTSTANALLFQECANFEGLQDGKAPLIHFNPHYDTSIIGFYATEMEEAGIPPYIDEDTILDTNNSFCICNEALSAKTDCEVGAFHTAYRNPKVEERVMNRKLSGGVPFTFEVQVKGLYCIGAYINEPLASVKDIGFKIEHTFGYLSLPEESARKVLRLSIILQTIGVFAFWWVGAGSKYRTLLLILTISSTAFSIYGISLLSYLGITGDSISMFWQFLRSIQILARIAQFSAFWIALYWISVAKPEVNSLTVGMRFLKDLPMSMRWMMSIYLIGKGLELFGLYRPGSIFGSGTSGASIFEVLELPLTITIWRSFTKTLDNPHHSSDFDPRLNRTRYAIIITPWALGLMGSIFALVQISLDIALLGNSPQGSTLEEKILIAMQNYGQATGVYQYFQNLVLYSGAVTTFLLLLIWKPMNDDLKGEINLFV